MAKTERELFEAGRLAGMNIFTPPKLILDDIKKHKWAFRWLNGPLLDRQGGFDERGWRPYLTPTELRKERKPGEYGEDVICRPDGTVRREDMILCIRPETMHQAAITAATKEARLALKSASAEAKEKGLEVERESSKKISRFDTEEILKE